MILAQTEPSSEWVSHVMAFVPWLIIFLFLWVAGYRALRKKSREDSALESIEGRLASVEEKLDRLLDERETRGGGG